MVAFFFSRVERRVSVTGIRLPYVCPRGLFFSDACVVYFKRAT